MKKKIAHLVSTYPPYGGGMGNVAFYMVDELASRGHLVEVITPDYDGQPEPKTKQEIKIKQKQVGLGQQISRLHPKATYGNAAILSNIDKQLDSCDIVHLHFPFYGSSNIARRWKLRNPNKKFVITYHMDSLSSGWKGMIFDLYAKYYTPKVLKAADVITVSSLDYLLHSNANDLYQKNKSKWVDISFGVDIKRFKEKTSLDNDFKNKLLKKYNLDISKKTVLFVGAMDSAHYFKGVEVLLNAITMLKSTGVQVQVIFIGKGNLLAQYKIKAKALKIESLVCFVGFVSDEYLPEYYKVADATVLPSINSAEAFGMVLLESMASGTPVIASNLPGVRILANKGGKTVNPNNIMDLAAALKSLITDQKFWSKKQSQVRNITEQEYTWQHVGDVLEKIYDIKSKNIYKSKVIDGDKIARSTGYPTANLDISLKNLHHSSGVYASEVMLGDKKYIGALVIMQQNHKPHKSVKIEVHLLDFADNDIYGKELIVTVLDKVSEIEKYTDNKALIKKIEKDIKLVRSVIK